MAKRTPRDRPIDFCKRGIFLFIVCSAKVKKEKENKTKVCCNNGAPKGAGRGATHACLAPQSNV